MNDKELEKLIKAEKKLTKKKKVKKVKKPKLKPTEEDIVKKYVNRVINNQKYHGWVDEEKFKNMRYEKQINKNIWMDNNFYFSVVFQSQDQVIDFLNHIGVTADEVGDSMKIVNGLKLAEKLGVKLNKFKSEKYPTGNFDLRPFVLDDEDL